MKIFTLMAVLLGSMITHLAMAQDSWPKTTTTSEGTIIKLYQWQPESFADNTLKAHAAISVLENGKSEPVFGVAWLKASTETRGDQVSVKSIYITNIKLPGESDESKLESLANTIEDKVASWDIEFANKDLQASLDLNKQQNALATQISNTPPKVIYTNVPSILVSIDGAPKLQANKDWGVEAVVNTPFVLVKNRDDKFYLYGGKHWYTAPEATGPYKLITGIPNNLNKIESAIKEADKKNPEENKETDANTIYNIVVTTEPAELIQSKGEANFSAVDGTGLLYVSNSENDIFMDINSQQYYVLLSGRWYKSKTLTGNWQYVAADQLPADFAKIPKGSSKDNVLASVAGTEEANDAIAEAQVPQTAKVERSKVRADVDYDGDPQFEAIDGTDMYYATNSPASVIRWRNRYYTVDNGVWFESYNAVGPWVVSVSRPYAVALIPPRYPVYYMKYVDIYDVTPDYVYMGYTPGYLNAYVYGPTVVYGTGYYYRPWYGRYYYARPYTWGFGIRYNPWFGWGFGGGFGWDWFNVSISFGNAYPWGYWGYGGWWGGPRVYRPCYYGPSYHYRGGYYGYNSYRSYRQYNNVTVVNNYYSNTNIYRGRNGIVTRDYGRGGYDRGPRYGSGGRGGRMGFADNGRGYSGGRFDRNGRPDAGGRIATPQNGGFNRDRFARPDAGGRRSFDSQNGIYNRERLARPDAGGRRGFDSQNGTYNRERLARPDNNGNVRGWRNNNDQQGAIRPGQGQRFANPNGGNRDWNNNPGRTPERIRQLPGRQPGSTDRPSGGWQQPQQRNFSRPYGGNSGDGGNRVFSPGRGSQPQGGGFSPRGGGNSGGFAPRGGGGNGGGSRPSIGSRDNGGGSSSGGGGGRGGIRRQG
ncbi:hypothetical protein [Niastella populi]|uniref:Carbohydrate-binding family V/XII n=1 Tax=Niastella populi TaxID=550983 RepID=A0A1V9EHK1_9BACT|nr:hypothetical protein [Niastella populi]OQP45606.1 hypothetical protein A4R26_08865 [Niastella populi]